MLDGKPLIVSFGGGINSAALLVGLYEHQIVPTLILFADTAGDDPLRRGEKPETYAFIDNHMQPWVKKHLSQEIVIVKHFKGDSLRASCFRNGTLPSKAYGMPGCSVKFKHQLMERYEKLIYGPDRIIIKAIGYHADETRRSDITEKGRYEYRYFLREWGWNQQDCINALVRHGLPVPMKSACYFCPSSKAHEVIWLRDNHPELFADAIAMEKQAEPYHAELGGRTKGLGRRWAWSDLIQITPTQAEDLDEPDPIPCMCYDGEIEES